MVYVTSDLHGCAIDVLVSLLQKVNFSDDDFLYILGDVIDRGLYGAELLFWITQQGNMELVLGNHEATLLACSFVFEEANDETIDSLSLEKMQLIENWVQNGGTPTIAGFRKLLRRDPESVEGILDYLRDCPLYEVVRLKDHTFILVHAGIENFSPSKALDGYNPDEFLMARPSLETVYFQDNKTTVVFGHTPTGIMDSSCSGKAIRTEDWICIDTGVALGNAPMLLRLNDLKEFYL